MSSSTTRELKFRSVFELKKSVNGFFFGAGSRELHKAEIRNRLRHFAV